MACRLWCLLLGEPGRPWPAEARALALILHGYSVPICESVAAIEYLERFRG